MYKYIYPLIKWKIKPWLKYYIVKKGEGTPSEIITTASPITIVNSLRKKFIKFIVGGNSIQDGEPSPTNEIPIQNVTGNVEVKVANGTDSTVTGYEEQTSIFPLEEGQVLHKGDTIEDKIVQRRGTYQFTGNENWVKSGNTTKISFCCYTNSIIPLAKNNGAVGLLNIGKVCNYQAISSYKNAFAYNIGNFHFLKIEKTAIPNWDESLTDAEKIALFKAYLAEQYANGTPVTLEYELETPIEIPFTEAQRTAKAQIDKLYSYKGTTHISSSNEPSPIFEVQYYMEGE